ncbi:MAG: alkaline phosphatase family protein [Theionarchaea archaeon]|nr:alkaline phosphatase family protein [Theionarchaea archaeon]MBU7038281.1 alkaline phosphatase family protein [Theionarchaea archaeon]
MKVLAVFMTLLLVTMSAYGEFGHASQVILLVVDGGDPEVLSLEGFPVEGQGTAVFPPMTSTGHISLLTGVYPSHHGILANEYNDEQKTRTYTSDMIEAKTLFEILKENRKKGIFISGKKGLAALAGATANLTVSPDSYPVYLRDPPQDQEGLTRWLFEAITEIDIREHPDFFCVNIPILDGVGHTYGPSSEECEEAARLVEDLIYSLRDSLDSETALIVTSDHGMSSVSKTVPIHALLRAAGYATWPLHVGRCAFLYDVEEGAREFVSNLEGVERIVEPDAYPTLHVDHESAPDLILVAKKGYLFIPEPLLQYYRGMHGSFDEQDIPLYMTGAGISSGYVECSQVDIAPLVVELLGLEPGVAFDGSVPQVQEKKVQGYGILVVAGVVLYLIGRNLWR